VPALQVAPVMPIRPNSIYVSAQDGLRLHLLEFGGSASSRLPVVCLPGITRTAEDFMALGSALAADGRRVLALDSRGRGRSQRDPDASRYSLPVELADLIAVLTATEATPCVLIGSSRGGLLIMLLAAQRPTAIAGAVLNDIGPVIETRGLVRIKSYVGKLAPRTLEEGAAMLRRVSEDQFPNLGDADWLAAARRTWRTEAGELRPTYDPRLAAAFEGIDSNTPPLQLWDQFNALAEIPLMIVRGANSDILSRATLKAMRERRREMESIEVPDQGHTPLLEEADVIGRTASFVARCGAVLDEPSQPSRPAPDDCLAKGGTLAKRFQSGVRA
jgi:pimeloyl-ACP methyl ester carboxylesterase